MLVFLAGVGVDWAAPDRDDGVERRDPVWYGDVQVGGELIPVELLPEGDGYRLCAIPGGNTVDRCVTVTDSNGIDARLDPSSTMDLLIVLSGSDRPLDLEEAAEIEFGVRAIHGALVPVGTEHGCASFSVPDPRGGRTTVVVDRTTSGGEDERDRRGGGTCRQIRSAVDDG